VGMTKMSANDIAVDQSSADPLKGPLTSANYPDGENATVEAPVAQSLSGDKYVVCCDYNPFKICVEFPCGISMLYVNR